VNHHYKTITTAENGTVSENTESVLGNIISKRIGESYTAAAVLNGFVQTGAAVDGAAVANNASVTVTVGAKTVIDFYYEKSVDNSITVPYSIAHEYFLYDWDGALIAESKPAPTTGSGFVTTSVTAAPEAGEYTLVKATYNGEDLAAPYTISLENGKNEIVFTYEKTLAREKAAYEVIHIYNRNGNEVGRTSEIIEGLHGEEIDSESIAHVTEYEGRTYKFRSVSEDIVLDSNEMKTIVLEYNRKTSSKPDPKPDPDPDPIEIPDEDVPLAPAPSSGDIEIPDEEVPLASVPKTGDESMKFILMALASALGLAGLTFTGKKREEEME